MKNAGIDEDDQTISNDSAVDISQTTLKQIFEFVGSSNDKENWAVNAENSSNGLNGSKEPFLQANKYIQESQIVQKNQIVQENQIMQENQIEQENQIIIYDSDSISYLCSFDQNCKDICKESLTVLQQRIVYGKVHSAYKKALDKVLQTNSKLAQLITLLQEFIDKSTSEQSDSNESLQSDSGDERNDSAIPKKSKEVSGKRMTIRYKTI
ncbi:10063_t:CDS:2 [Dentiscutata heterogama]|uniref:10063_t:CDS:1 n=1 Tax=Dentiscutata heterogama TaxID=1316150 RepID=A0ACA9KCT6_9GLOM|nr:10063_t:CDS:2 [Dentiscutata heterogama]